MNRCSSTESWIPLILSSTCGYFYLASSVQVGDDKGQGCNCFPQTAPLSCSSFSPLLSFPKVKLSLVLPQWDSWESAQDSQWNYKFRRPHPLHQKGKLLPIFIVPQPLLLTVPTTCQTFLQYRYNYQSINQSINQICSRGRFPTNYELITFLCRWQWGRRRRKCS